MSEDIRKMINRVKNFKPFVNEQKINKNYTNTNINVGDVYSESDVYPYIQKLHRNEDDFYDGDIGERIETFQKYQVSEIPIDKINMDEYELDDDYVNDYVEKYKQIGTYPPIVLGDYDDNWGYNIIDGTHRANALKNVGLKSIICFVGLNEQNLNTHVYHGTGKGQALNIQRDGYMKPNNTGEEQMSISFTDKFDYAKHYAKSKGGLDKMCILRTKLNDTFKLSPRIVNNKGHEYITYKNILSSDLEVLTTNGEWKPLNNWNVVFDEPL